ncbi:hypothetical protein ACODG4_04265 [Vagococcus fluvialis]|uniref:hypothetical protein n=1 Tax=Vagococcus fluvialis TaxID=2738 RepID=UPI003B5C3D00
MARRLISTTIVSSAKFLKMPPSTQNLYFHLMMNADDDGITEGFSVMRLVGANEDDLKVLVSKDFVVILNEDLVTYVTDWLVHNKIRADRKVDSVYQQLLLKVLPDVEIRKSTKKKELPNNVGQLSDSSQTKVGISKGKLSKDKLREANPSKDNNIDQSSSKEADKASLKNSFESIWKFYPKKQGKDKAFKSYQRAIRDGVTDEDILNGLNDYLKQIEVQKTDTQFIKQGSTWFNGKHWQDEYVTKSETTNQKRGYEREVDLDW